MTKRSGREVLLTGATGFVGKVVLEALLRRRAELGVERVHLLIRPGAAGTARERFALEIERSPCLAGLAAALAEHVEIVEGDISRPGCGLSPEAQARIAERVTHVVHAAASVEFDLPVAEAEAVNVGGCLALLELAQRARRLERLTVVSTAYVTPHPADGAPVRETLAPLPRPAREIRAEIRAGAADEKALLRETGHPNTYTLTKCLAEHLLVEGRGAVPLAIVRPSVVSASWRHPFPGWIDSSAAFAGFVALVGAGHLRAVVARPASRIDLVPVDVVAARILDAAFDAEGAADVDIRHAVAGLAASPTIEECRAWLTDFFRRHPVDRRPAVPYLGPAGPGFTLARWRHHELPIRLGGLRSERTRRAGRRLRARLAHLNRAFPYFTSNTFDFRTRGPQAQAAPEPRTYVETVCRGIHRHLLRRDPSEVPLAGRRGPDLGGDLRFVLRQPEGGAAIRAVGWLVTKVLRRCTDLVSFDLESFERARRAVPEGAAIVLAPCHRSYLDFVLCSYLCFARPDLDIEVPHIAAAVEFSRIPVLGPFLGNLRTFYLERGAGREEKALTARVHALVREGKTLEFFIEGARSRARRFLEPKRGFLRCLQATGHPVALLPVAFGYDRVPEEASFVRELAGAEKPPMRLSALLGWTWRMLRGEVQLGRVHIACGAPVSLDLGSDVRAVARAVVAELQQATPVSSYHLRAFVARRKPDGVGVRALAEAIRARGGRVLESSLTGVESLDPRVESALAHQLEPFFYAEARRLLGAHPALAHHLERNAYCARAAGEEAQADEAPAPLDALAAAVVARLFEPICRDYERVAAVLGEPGGPLGVDSPAALVRREPERHLPNVEAAFEDLARRGILAQRGAVYVWGARAGELPRLRALYAWPEERA